MYTTLLSRQIKKYLKDEFVFTAEWQNLLDAVNRSYEHYERDHVLGKKSLEISTAEMRQLADEIAEKETRTHKEIALRHEVTRTLLHSSSLEEAAPKILSRLCKTFDWDLACFWVKESDRLSCKFLYPEQRGENLQIYENEKRSCNSFNKHARSEAARKHGFNYICFNVEFEKQSLGYVELFSKSPVRNDSELHKLLQDIGSEIGVFIKHLMLMKEHELQKQLIIVARQAGMMQVATNVLHNVGNVLNSVNISASLLRENFVQSELHQLPKIVKLIKENESNLNDFLQNDTHGKHILTYLYALSDLWQKEYQTSLHELELLFKNVKHIKDTIQVQQSMSGSMGVKEKISINQLLNDLIHMLSKECENKKIKILKEYGHVSESILDKGRLLQILMNLIRNAMDAVENNEVNNKKIIFKTWIDDEKFLHVAITDNGCGIEQDNLINIFSFGFTTKTDGHGFGLHSSAILAKEMGGSLSTDSRGIGYGSTFSLVVPFESTE